MNSSEEFNSLSENEDNNNEQTEKAQCSIEGYETTYVWKGFTTNLISYLYYIHQITKELFKDKSLKINPQMIQQLDEHNASDIIESVNLVLNKFNIEHSKIFTITTDNSSNIKSAMQQLNITNVKCTKHTLQLSVNLGLKELREVQLQITPGLKQPLDIIKDVNTCWNSILYAIKCLMHLKPTIIQLYSTLTNHTIREIRKGAETIVTQFLSGSKYPTLRFMTPILEELACQLSALHHSTIQNMHCQFNELCPTPTSDNNNNDDSILVFLHSYKKSKMSTFFMYLQTENSNIESNEFDQYCQLPEISLNEESCSLEWWHKYKTLFPIMTILMRPYLAVPACSVPSK
ncbi:19439_t:CDS:2, partial [Cetraspora pellucida]